MKSVCCCVLAVAMLLLLGSPVSAASVYELDALGFKLTIPDGYTVITRDTPADDPVFDQFGITKEEYETLTIPQFIYLDAFSNMYDEEIVVTMTDGTFRNFSLFSDTTLSILASGLEDLYTTHGSTFQKYDIYQHKQAKFIRVYYKNAATGAYCLQYYTMYDSKAINITLHSYDASINARQERIMKTLVDNVSFYNEPPAYEPGEDTEAFLYTHKESGVVFTVPENWTQEPFIKEREYIDVMFVSTKEEGCSIVFGATDMWDEMTATEKMGTTRENWSSSIFTREDIAEMYMIPVSQVSTVTYSGREYYKVATRFSTDLYGYEMSLDSTVLIYAENCWLYTYQFTGDDEHPMYSDFERLMCSVEYPDLPETASPTIADAPQEDNGFAGILFAVLLGVGAVSIVAILLVRKRKASEKPWKTIQKETAAAIACKLPPQKMCRSCGMVLGQDSMFCRFCGAKIEKEK